MLIKTTFLLRDPFAQSGRKKFPARARYPQSLIRLFQIGMVAAMGCLLQVAASAGVYKGATDTATFAQLQNDLESRSVMLANRMAVARAAGLCTDYALVSQVTINLFKNIFVPWDRSHPTEIQAAYAAVNWGSKDPVGAAGLPFDELADCLEVADTALADLQQQIDGAVVLPTPPNFAASKTVLNGRHFELNGRRVFPTKFFWEPFDEAIMQAYGRVGEGYYSLSDMATDTTVKSGRRTTLTNSMSSQSAVNRVPQQFFLGHVMDSTSWQRTSVPEAFSPGNRLFTDYDIDHPSIRPWLDQLFSNLLGPAVTASGNVPRIHMIANEPTFAIRQGGVNATNGVSAYTMTRYRAWLQAKYTSISNLNGVYGSSFPDFASVNYTIPLSMTYQGGPVWYDWCRFNMDRVNDWFTYLHNGVHSVDANSSTHIKAMGERSIITQYHDEGLDFETMARLVDMPGSDNQCNALRSEFDSRLEQDWRNRYAMEWRAQSIMLDFNKSICPEKPIYDSEWHGLSGSRWRDFHMEPSYVRTALWMAVTHGLSAMNAWVWNRKEDGSIDTRADFIGTTVTQPLQLDAFGRWVKELNAHGNLVTSLVPSQRYYIVYYSKDSAIQDPTYTANMANVYESLKLLNIPVGFTTPTDLGKVTGSAQTVIVPPTAFISNADLAGLRAFSASGGKIILTQPSNCFVKNELGGVRTDGAGFTPFATVNLAGVLPMADAFKSALAPRKPTLPVSVTITDTSAQPAYGVLSSQFVDPTTGIPVVSLINLSKSQRNLSIQLSAGGAVNIHNLITGQPGIASFSMAPNDVLLLSTGGPLIPGSNSTFKTYDFSSSYTAGNLGAQKNWTGSVHTIDQGILRLTESTNWSIAVQNTGVDTVNYDQYTALLSCSFSEKGGFANTGQFMNVMLRSAPSGGSQVRLSLERTDADNYAVRIFNDASPAVQYGYKTFKADTIGLDVGADTDLDSDRLKLALTLKKGSTAGSWTYTATVDNLDTNTNVVTSTGTMSTGTGLFSAATLYGSINGGPVTSPTLAFKNRVIYSTTIGGTATGDGWSRYVTRNGLTGNPLADRDSDGQSDLWEFALGGNATNSSVTAPSPIIQATAGGATFTHLEISDPNPGITYIPEWTENLAAGPWSSNWDTTTRQPTANPDYSSATRQLIGGNRKSLFFRVRVTQP